MARSLILRSLLATALFTLGTPALTAHAADAPTADAMSATGADDAVTTSDSEAAKPAAKPAKPASKAKPAAAKPGKTAKADAKPAGPAAKAGVSKADIDLWSFSVSNKLAPGKTLAEFRALPGITDEKSATLEGSDDAATAAKNPAQAVTFTFGDSARVRVINFGEQAFITHIRVNGSGYELLDGLKIGATRAEVEAQLGKPTRGSTTYTVYEGAQDIVRFYYSNNLVTAVEIDRGA